MMHRDTLLDDIHSLLPQAPPMVLLDRALSADDGHARAEATLRPDHPFIAADGGVPAWVGIELMAQTIAVFAGARARRNGRLPSIGYLVSTRDYRALVPRFEVGDRLEVEVDCLFEDPNGMFSFRCGLRRDAALLAEATVNCFDGGHA
jgi:predicted hotdog family 3-hydroxylacyl-ACP dehydratase